MNACKEGGWYFLFYDISSATSKFSDNYIKSYMCMLLLLYCPLVDSKPLLSDNDELALDISLEGTLVCA